MLSNCDNPNSAYMSFMDRFHIVILWLAGQLTGVLLGTRIPPQVIQALRLTNFTAFSFWTLVVVQCLPMALLYFSVCFRNSVFLSLLIFLKSLTFAFTVCCVAQLFSYAGWLMRWLLFFSSCVGTFVYLLFVLNACFTNKEACLRIFIICIAVLFFAILIDQYVILPFVISLQY